MSSAAEIFTNLEPHLQIARDKTGFSDRLILEHIVWADGTIPCLDCLRYGWTEEKGNGHGICHYHSQRPSEKTMAAYLEHYKGKTD